MSADTKTPLALYKANLELVMRLGALLQENRRNWTRLGLSHADEALTRTLSQTERLLTSNDWTSLAALPGDAFWKSLQAEASQTQGTVGAAVANQSSFMTGMQEAFAAWQQQCADAMQGAAKLPTGASFEEFVKAFRTAGGQPAEAPQPAPNKTSRKR